MTDERTIDDIPVPALLRAARGAYGTAVRSSLAASGFEDLPPNGPFVLGGIVNHGENVRDLLRGLGMNRERGRELLVTLVQRGYMQRTADEPGEDDPERIPVEPTDRGRAAAAAVQSAIHRRRHAARDALLAGRDQRHALGAVRPEPDP